MTTARDVSWVGGGTAQWGRQVPLAGSDLNTVGYEADFASRLQVGEGDDTTYFRTIFTGQDQVAKDGTVPRGYGAVRMEDIHTGEWLLGHIDWFMKDGKDKGTLTLDGGTGRWEGVSGTVDLDLEFSTARAGDTVITSDPVRVMGFIEGVGRLSFPN